MPARPMTALACRAPIDPDRAYDRNEDKGTRSKTMISNVFASIMNPKFNPLRHLPKIMRFQLMTIMALMWSVVFSVWSGMVMLAGALMAVHVILLIGAFFTDDISR